MDVYQTWLDAVSDNIANVNTIRSTDEAAYQERMVVVSSASRNGKPAGAVVTKPASATPKASPFHDPTHPLADAEGMVRAPDMSLSDQMTHMLIAQRAYQANVSASSARRDRRALEIGGRQ
ncbi:MAG: hypothetical protein R2710_12395 [Acidimicrobiales bacterium]